MSNFAISLEEAMRRLLLVQKQLGFTTDLSRFSEEEIDSSLKSIQNGEVFYVLDGAGIVRVDMQTGQVVDGQRHVPTGVKQVKW